MPEPLVIWRLTDGKAGHMQQTLGLVRALARLTPCTLVDIDVTRAQVGLLDLVLGRVPWGDGNPLPGLIVGAGHRTHLPLLASRRAAGGRAVVLMRPSLPVRCFDLVVTPLHDALAEGPRVVATRGVLNSMRPGEKQPGTLLFLIGGPSRHVQWSDAAVLEQIEAVTAALPAGAAWRLTDSRRTPDSMRAELAGRYGDRFLSFSSCPDGWLAEQLAATDNVWVSEDSVSMLYEALTAGCRVGVLRVPHAAQASRVIQGVEEMVADGVVTTVKRWRDEGAMPAADGFDEADRVARLLLQRLGLPGEAAR